MEWLYIVVLFLIPITLVLTGTISASWRLWLLAGIGVIVATIQLHAPYSLDTTFLHIPDSSFDAALLDYVIGTATGIMGLWVLHKLFRTNTVTAWYRDPHFLFLFIPISFAQQFLYQGFLLPVAIVATNSWGWGVIITALTFGYMHSIYPNPLRHMTIGTLGGTLFALLFTIAPNLYVAVLSHMILNWVAVYNGFFSFLYSDNTPKRTEIIFNPRRIQNS